MELNSFARIGKGVISKAIGLQKNYTQIIVNGPNVLDEAASGCYNCACYNQSLGITDAMQDSMPCTSCTHAIYKPSHKVKTIYMNERNRYGYQPTLKSKSIKLLLLYHFHRPDGNGFIKNVNEKELADKIGCTVATIRACNKVLQLYGYCYVSASGTYDNFINVLLPEYKNYHKTAAEGGRGYITMSSDMLSELLSIKYLNPLRLNLKGILEVDNARINGSDSVISPFKKLRGFLPRYCKNNVIKAALENTSAILDTSFSEQGVIFKIRDIFSQKQMRKELFTLNQKGIEEYVAELNDNLERYKDATSRFDMETAGQLWTRLTAQGITPTGDIPYISLHLSDYSDLAALSVQYNIHMVFTAIKQIYSSYIVSKKPIDNFGALARTFIRNNVDRKSVV